MKNILNEILNNLNNEIINFYYNSDLTIDEAEKFMETTLKEAICKLLSAYYEHVDKELYNDKKLRKEEGLVVEHKNRERQVISKIGMINFQRTYYKCKFGGYVYPVDRVAGLEGYERISMQMSKDLVKESINHTYKHASEIVSDGSISKQTVMRKIRDTKVVKDTCFIKKKVGVLHIDADEDHINLQTGENTIAPLVSVYEGIAKHGKRKYCKNIFHNSFFGVDSDEIWEEVLTGIDKRYDMSEVKIYLHGDGASWIKKGLEWLPNTSFVLDRYHLNKYIKSSLAGLDRKTRNKMKTQLKEALYNGNIEEVIRIRDKVLKKTVSIDKHSIVKSYNYLIKNIDGIIIYRNDKEASNGGATEPHVSHVLSDRFSSRPKGWSRETLKCLVPLRTADDFEISGGEEKNNNYIEVCVKEVKRQKSKPEFSLGLCDPDNSVELQSGKVTPIRKLFKMYCV